MSWYERFSVQGKKVLLTGAAGGIGHALLTAFLEADAEVFAVTRRADTDWRNLPLRFGPRFHSVMCDLADPADVREFALRIDGEFPLDVLINCASDCPHVENGFYDLNLLHKTMAVTLDAAYVLCGELAPKMGERGGGSIINVTTMNAEMAWPGNPSYIAAKSALRMLTKAVARDYGGKGVRANNLCPGYVRSRLTEASYQEPAKFEERRAHTMLGRWGTPDDMVGPCLFLASDASRYVTATDLHVEGGWLAKGM